MPIDPTALIDGGIDDYRVLAEQKGLALDWSSEAPKSTLKFDEYCFTHMLSNLLNNAIKFTERGRVGVRFFQGADGGLALEVSDTGIGMEPKLVSRLFEPFSREQRKGGATSGAGLGLAVAKRYLELNARASPCKRRWTKAAPFSSSFHRHRKAARTLGISSHSSGRGMSLEQRCHRGPRLGA